MTDQVTPEVTPDVDAVNISQERVDEPEKREHEPVAWVTIETALDGDWRKVPSIKWFNKPTDGPLYTAPPISDYHEGWEEGFKAAKREWVGLTEANKSTAIKLIEAGMFNLAFKYLEEQLKEKNYESS